MSESDDDVTRRTRLACRADLARVVAVGYRGGHGGGRRGRGGAATRGRLALTLVATVLALGTLALILAHA